jgi:hypothetical protein
LIEIAFYFFLSLFLQDSLIEPPPRFSREGSLKQPESEKRAAAKHAQ